MDLGLSVARKPKPIFDFTPLLASPAVYKAALPYGRPQIVDIPETRIPSPLAPHLSPQVVQDLKNHLIGDGTFRSAYGRRRGGEEVWESWKRAWDLWNNHYIEGRTSPVWIRAEYERIKKEMDDEAIERRRRPRKPHHPPAHPPVPTGPPFHGDTPPTAKPGKMWQKTKLVSRHVPSGKTRLVLTGRMVRTDMPVTRRRALPSYTTEIRSKGETVPVIALRPMTEIVEIQQTVRAKEWYPLASYNEITAQRLAGQTSKLLDDDEVEPKETRVESYYEEREVMDYQVIDIVGDKQGPLLTYAQTTANRKAGKKVVPPTGTSLTNINQRPTMWAPVMEPYYSGTRVLALDERLTLLQFEDVDVDFVDEQIERDIMETRDQQEWIEIDDPNAIFDGAPTPDLLDTGIEMNLDDDTYDNFSLDLIEIDDLPELVIPLAREVTNAQGESGGFLPMKLLDEYPEPDVDLVTGQSPVWFDAIQNTVWRPRRVGERHVKIDVDDCFEDFVHRSELAVDGGADCGRSPFPVLRSMIEYVSGNYIARKKKVWDKVFGTIFNMPTKPVDNSSATEDERQARMKAVYGDMFRDFRDKHRHDFFPLDIRRVKRYNDAAYTSDVPTPLLEHGEQLQRWPWHNLPKSYPDLDNEDPWKVTPAQELSRDVPPRKYPLPHSTAPETGLMPVFDQSWLDEIDHDDTHQWRYFVTNLHGGTLIINGKEIKKGAIAGPLPRFAVIESPGGQVSFWWGVGGRNWLEGVESPAAQNQWRILRNMPEWENVGLLAGQVWDYRIRERITRELSGNEYDDDKEWEEWKHAVPTLEPCAKPDYIEDDNPIVLRNKDENGISIGNEVIQPETFPTEEAELKWIYTKAKPLAQAILEAQTNNFILPDGPSFFPGQAVQETPYEVQLQQIALQEWNAGKDAIMQGQKDDMKRLQQEQADKDATETARPVDINRKRKAAADAELPSPKRTYGSFHEDVLDAESHVLATRQNGVQYAKEERVKALVLEFDAAVAARRLADHSLSPAYKTTAEALTLEKEQEAAAIAAQLKAINDQRAARGQQPLPAQHGPTSRQILNAWLRYKHADIKAQDARPVAHDQLHQDRMATNAQAEADRLEKLRIDEEAAMQKAAEAKAKKDVEDAANAVQSAATKLAQERLEKLGLRNADKAVRARLEAERKKKEDADKAEAARLQDQADAQARRDSIARRQEATEHARREAEQRRLEHEQQERDATATRKKLELENNTALPPGTTAEDLALQRDRDDRTHSVKASLHLRAASAYLAVVEYLRTLNWFRGEDEWIADQVNNPAPAPALKKHTPFPSPQTQDQNRPLAANIPEPVHPGMIPAVRTSWLAARHSLERAFARGLKAQASLSQTSELEIALARGYIEEDAHNFNLAALLDPDDIPVFPVQNIVPPEPVLAPGGGQAARNAYDLLVLQRTVVLATNNAMVQSAATATAKIKKQALAQRVHDAEDFGAQSDALERPRVVDINRMAPVGRGGGLKVVGVLGDPEIFLD